MQRKNRKRTRVITLDDKKIKVQEKSNHWVGISIAAWNWNHLLKDWDEIKNLHILQEITNQLGIPFMGKDKGEEPTQQQNTSRLEIHSLYNNGFECRFDRTGENQVFLTQYDHKQRLGERVLYRGIKPINQARRDYKRLLRKGWTTTPTS